MVFYELPKQNNDRNNTKNFKCRKNVKLVLSGVKYFTTRLNISNFFKCSENAKKWWNTAMKSFLSGKYIWSKRQNTILKKERHWS